MKSSKKKGSQELVNFEQDDEFQFSNHENEVLAQYQIKDKKPIASIYKDLLQQKKTNQQNLLQRQKIQSKKDKKKAKQILKKQHIKQEVSNIKQMNHLKKAQQKYPPSLVILQQYEKFIDNKKFQDQLKKTTLKGVTKIFNMISAYKKEMES